MKQVTSIAALSLVSLAGTAFGQVGLPTYASGFLHTEVGVDTSLSVSGRSVTADTPNNAGDGGVEVRFESREGGRCDVDVSGLYGPTNVGRRKEVKFKAGAELAHTVNRCAIRCLATSSDGTNQSFRLEYDFSEMSAAAVEVVCRNQNGDVVGQFVVNDPNVVCDRLTTTGPLSLMSWSFGASNSHLGMRCFHRFDKASPLLMYTEQPGQPPVFVPDVVEVLCRPICIVSPCPGEWTNLRSMEVTSTMPQITVSDAALDWSWGATNHCTSCGGPSNVGRVLVHGVGDAHIIEEVGDLDGDGTPDPIARATNIGTSGQDGLTVHIPGGASALREKWTNGHVTLMKLTDDDANVEARVIVTNNLPTGGALSLTPDFLSMGATSSLVTAYDSNGAVLAARPIGAGMSVDIFSGITCVPPFYPKWVFQNGRIIFAGCGGSGGYEISVPGSPPVTGVSSVSLEPLGAITSMTRVHRLTLTSNDATDIVLGGLELFDTSGPSCDSIDFNGDGLFPDATDIDDYLSVFSGGLCSDGTLCNDDIDFNNDELFPDSLDIDSLLSVFSGGSCL